MKLAQGLVSRTKPNKSVALRAESETRNLSRYFQFISSSCYPSAITALNCTTRHVLKDLAPLAVHYTKGTEGILVFLFNQAEEQLRHDDVCLYPEKK